MTEHWKSWRVSEMTDEECVKALMPPKFEFWLYNHLRIVWRIVYWKWTGEKSFLLFAKHWFKEWRNVR